MKEWDCPLCGGRVSEDRIACGGCPVKSMTGAGHGCGVLCCPRCGYQFIERSSWLDSLRRLWREREAP